MKVYERAIFFINLLFAILYFVIGFNLYAEEEILENDYVKIIFDRGIQSPDKNYSYRYKRFESAMTKDFKGQNYTKKDTYVSGYMNSFCTDILLKNLNIYTSDKSFSEIHFMGGEDIFLKLLDGRIYRQEKEKRWEKSCYLHLKKCSNNESFNLKLKKCIPNCADGEEYIDDSSQCCPVLPDSANIKDFILAKTKLIFNKVNY